MAAHIILSVPYSDRWRYLVPEYPEHCDEHQRESWRGSVQRIFDAREKSDRKLRDCLTVGGAKIWARRRGCFLDLRVHGYAYDGRDVLYWCRVADVDPNRAEGIHRSIIGRSLDDCRRN